MNNTLFLNVKRIMYLYLHCLYIFVTVKTSVLMAIFVVRKNCSGNLLFAANLDQTMDQKSHVKTFLFRISQFASFLSCELCEFNSFLITRYYRKMKEKKKHIRCPIYKPVTFTKKKIYVRFLNALWLKGWRTTTTNRSAPFVGVAGKNVFSSYLLKFTITCDI